MNILYYLRKHGIKVAANYSQPLTAGHIYRGVPFRQAVGTVVGSTPVSAPHPQFTEMATSKVRHTSALNTMAGPAVPFLADAAQLNQLSHGMDIANNYLRGPGADRTRAAVLNMSLPEGQATITPEQVAQSRGAGYLQQPPTNSAIRKSDFWSALWQNLPYYYFGRA